MEESTRWTIFAVEGCQALYFHILKIADEHNVRSSKVIDHNEFTNLVKTFDTDHVIWWLQYDHFIFTYLSLKRQLDILSRRKNQKIIMAHIDDKISIPDTCVFVKRDLEVIKQQLPEYFTKYCTLIPPT